MSNIYLDNLSVESYHLTNQLDSYRILILPTATTFIVHPYSPLIGFIVVTIQYNYIYYEPILINVLIVEAKQIQILIY